MTRPSRLQRQPLDDPAGVLLDALAGAGDPMALVVIEDDVAIVVWANRALSEALRIDTEELRGTALDELVSTSGDLDLNPRRSTTFAVSVSARDGARSVWNLTAVPSVRDGIRSWAITMRPPPEDDSLDELLSASEERFRALAERAPIGIFSSEVGLRWGYVNDQLADMVEAASESLLGTGWTSFVHPTDLDRTMGTLQSTLVGDSAECGLRLVTTAGEERWINLRVVPVTRPGSPAGFLGTIEDITERRRFEELLSWQATHDPLTGLPNRALLGEELSLAIVEPDGDVALLFFDLDGFKEVNDTFGHRCGDHLLVAVADRMRTAVRGNDSVFRFAGDEFVILARGVADDREAIGVAERIRAAVAVPVELDGVEIEVGCSVGVVRAEADATEEELVRDADLAMYTAKRTGKGRVAIFDHAHRAERQRQRELIGRVRRSVIDGGISVTYSAVRDAEGNVVGHDAEISYHDAVEGSVPSERVRELAATGGCARELGTLLLQAACDELVTRRAAGETGWISVPVGATELLDDRFCDDLARLVVTTGLTAHDLWIHLCSTGITDDEQRISSVLSQVRDLGLRVTVAMDSAGEYPLAMPARIPVDGFRLHFDPASDEAARLTLDSLVAIAVGRSLRLLATGDPIGAVGWHGPRGADPSDWWITVDGGAI